MSQPNSTRTPFDDDLVFDPNAPRHTQPLPPHGAPNSGAQNVNAQNGAPQNTAPQNPYVYSAPQSTPPHQPVPPQVTPNRTAQDDDFIPTRKLHPGTRAGFLVAGGALAMLIFSVVAAKLLPRSTDGTPTNIPMTPRNGTIVMTPPDDNANTDSSIKVLPSGNAASTRDAADNSATPQDDATPRTVTSRRGYSIDVPGGFRLQRSGRRTLWTHRDGTNILVETSRATSSPRDGWEKLDRSLSRKYGDKYRSFGIRDTQIDSHDAAVWEFELDLPSGTKRKLDVAIHDGARGYAVLGSAPADKFETARPRIEAAINSFRVTRNAPPTVDSKIGSDSGDSNDTGNNNGGIVGDLSRAAGDAAKSAAGSVAAAAREQVAKSGIADRVKSSVKSTISGAVNNAVDGAVDGVVGPAPTPVPTPEPTRRRRRHRASTREKIESPQPAPDAENADAPVRNEGY